MIKDRTDIACIIAEWWHNQKVKKDLLESTITLEQFLQIDKLEPLEVVEEKIQIVLQKPGGRRKVIYKAKVNGKKNGHPVLGMYEFDGIQYRLSEEEIKRLEVEKRLAKLGCDTCHYEIYYQSEQEDYVAWNRDCLKDKAQDYFNRSCPLKFSRVEIAPAVNCPYWTKVKIINEPQQEKIMDLSSPETPGS